MQSKADALLRAYYEKVEKGDKDAKVPSNYRTLAANAKANIAFTGTFTFKGANGRPIQAEFIRPDGIMKYTMIIATPLYAASFKGNLLTNAAQVLLCVIALLAMMICAAIVVLQYIMAMVEYQILVGVGILLVPFALFDKTRFITEKFVGAIFGHLMKIILIIVIIGVFSGSFVSLAKMDFTGSLDQIVKYVFTMLLYAILASSVPAIATGILSGSPSLTGDTVLNTARTVLQGIQTAGVIAGAAKQFTGSAMQTGYQGLSRGIGALSEAAGAAAGAREGVRRATACAVRVNHSAVAVEVQPHCARREGCRGRHSDSLIAGSRGPWYCRPDCGLISVCVHCSRIGRCVPLTVLHRLSLPPRFAALLAEPSDRRRAKHSASACSSSTGRCMRKCCRTRFRCLRQDRSRVRQKPECLDNFRWCRPRIEAGSPSHTLRW